MPFFEREPFDTAEATYVWTGLGSPDSFWLEFKGHAPVFTSGLQLLRDTGFVGGLAIEVMGWTGPLLKDKETTPYNISGHFKGTYAKEIFVVGLNQIEIVHVREVRFQSDKEYMISVSSL